MAKQLGRPKGQGDVTPKIRRAFLRAVKICAKGGKPLDQLIADSLLTDTLGTLKAIASFTPRSSIGSGNGAAPIQINVLTYHADNREGQGTVIESTGHSVAVPSNEALTVNVPRFVSDGPNVIEQEQPSGIDQTTTD